VLKLDVRLFVPFQYLWTYGFWLIHLVWYGYINDYTKAA